MQTDIDKRMDAKYSGNFLEPCDITSAGGNITVTIADVVAPDTEKDSAGKLIDKAIVSFHGAKKRWILNKLNNHIIKTMHGKTSQWGGKQITLTVRYLKESFGETNVQCVRVLLPDDVTLSKKWKKHYGSDRPFGSPGSKSPTRRRDADETDLSDVPFGGREPGDD